MSKSITCCITIIILFQMGIGAPYAAAPETRAFHMGFTPFPWDFSLEALQDANTFVAEHGDIVSHHIEQGVPWPEALNDQPYHENLMNEWKNRKAASAGKKVFLSLNALTDGRNALAHYRGEKENMPLPESFQGKALNDPDVKTAYLHFCRKAIEFFDPDYFAIGIEVNELIHNAPGLWPAYKELYSHVYQALKKDHPALPVFATVSLHNLNNRGWQDLEFQRKEIKEFLQNCDIAGISFYPFMAGYDETPTELFDWLKEFTDKPIAITETGYLAETLQLETYNLTIESNAQKQKVFVENLLQRAQKDDYEFVIHFLYRDYDALWEKIESFAPEAFKVWRDCGLYDEAGTPRPAMEVWEEYREVGMEE